MKILFVTTMKPMNKENFKDTNIIIPKTFEDYIKYKNNQINIYNNQENIIFIIDYIKKQLEKYEYLINLTEKCYKNKFKNELTVTNVCFFIRGL